MVFTSTTALLTSTALFSSLVQVQAAPTDLSRRAAGDSIWFTINFWSTKATTISASHWHHAETNVTKTQADFHAPEDPPTTRTPEGQDKEFALVGDMNFERVPDEGIDREVWVINDADTEQQTSVKCSINFSEDPGPADVHWYIGHILDVTEKWNPNTNLKFTCEGDVSVSAL